MSTETQTLESTVEYEIDPDGVSVGPDMAVHREVGESEFPYVLVGSDPDTDENGSRVAFGFHKGELDIPVPEPNEEDGPSLTEGETLKSDATGRCYTVTEISDGRVSFDTIPRKIPVETIRKDIDSGSLEVVER